MKKQDLFLCKMNKIILKLSFSGGTFATAGFIFDYLSGTRQLIEVIIIALITLGAPILSSFIYKNNSSSSYIKPICIFAFIIYYGFLYITYPTFLPFVFIFPILTLETLFADKRALLFEMIVVILINIIGAFIKLSNRGITIQLKSELIMQFGVLLAFMISIFLIVNLYAKSKDETFKTLEKLNASKEKQQNILSDILKLIKVSNNNSKDVYHIVDKTSIASENINNNIVTITETFKHIAKNIEEEDSLIRNIESKVSNTVIFSSDMEKSFDIMESDLEKGIYISLQLSEKSEFTNENYNTVYNGILRLKDKVHEISKITKVITDIADNTNLLALNAAIEAASAGIHGKGFSVVANEVKNLANESKIAIQNISSIVQDIVTETDNNVSSITNLKNINKSQNILINNNKDTLINTKKKVNLVKEKMHEVNTEINYIFDATGKINDSISYISCASENILNDFEKILSILKENIDNSKTAQNLAQELNDTSKDMEKYL